MHVKILTYPGDVEWLDARNDALSTRRQETNKVPSSKIKTKFILSEHSPIKELKIRWKWCDLPSWVSVHFVRHGLGITQFVSSQRNDMQNLYDRRKAPQDAPVDHRAVANFLEIMHISQKRLCLCASTETRQAWQMFLDAMQPIAPELHSCCVRPCVYRNGICPEVFSDCKFNKSKKFQEELEKYLQNFKMLKGKYEDENK